MIEIKKTTYNKQIIVHSSQKAATSLISVHCSQLKQTKLNRFRVPKKTDGNDFYTCLSITDYYYNVLKSWNKKNNVFYPVKTLALNCNAD